MNPLFAHHIELMHVPVLVAIFGAGFWLGWSLIARLSGSGKSSEVERLSHP